MTVVSIKGAVVKTHRNVYITVPLRGGMGGQHGVEYRSLASLGWLYLVQGIPYGLQDKFIPVQLRSLGLNYSRLVKLVYRSSFVYVYVST